MSLTDIDFFTEATADVVEQQQSVKIETPAAKPVSQEVKVRPSTGRSSHLLNKDWTWEEMRDYVISEIERYHGPQVRNPVKEKAIFSAFLNRWGQDCSKLIAQTAFDVYEGMWCNAPISVNRFCKSSDDFFARKIIEKLSE